MGTSQYLTAPGSDEGLNLPKLPVGVSHNGLRGNKDLLHAVCDYDPLHALALKQLYRCYNFFNREEINMVSNVLSYTRSHEPQPPCFFLH